MKFTIDTDKIKNSGMSISEFLFTLSCYLEDPITQNSYVVPHGNDYVRYEDVTEDLKPDKFKINPRGEDYIQGVLADTKLEDQEVIDSYDEIASAMIDLFPKGRKEGTNYLWRDSKLSISRRLKTLATKYGVSFTKDQAIKATNDYIKSFNGFYKNMRLLKYFIYKIEIKDGKEELCSDFAAFLENENDVNVMKEDWLNTLL